MGTGSSGDIVNITNSDRFTPDFVWEKLEM